MTGHRSKNRAKVTPATILTSAPVFRSECLRPGCLFGFSGGGWHGCHPFLETVWCLFTIFNSLSLGQEFVEQQIGRCCCDDERTAVLAHCRKGWLASNSGLLKMEPENDGLHLVLVANDANEIDLQIPSLRGLLLCRFRLKPPPGRF